MSPGPDFVVTLRQTLNYGKRYAYYSSLGIGLGIAVHLSYTFLGIGFVLEQFPIVFNIIKFLGAFYLIYLGIENLRDTPSKIVIDKENNHTYTLKKSFMAGFLCNLLNPKATLFFLSIFTSLISSETPFYIQLLYGFFCIIANIIWYDFIAYFLSKDRYLRWFNKHQVKIERIIGIVLVLLGLKLISGQII